MILRISISFLTRILFCFALVTFVLSRTSYSQNESETIVGNPHDDLNAEQIIEKYKPALVSIWYNDKNFYSYVTYSYVDTTMLSGSGFIFSEDGLIGTNYHVIENIDSLIVKTSEGLFYNAELLFVDEKNDFAIIKLDNSSGKKFETVVLGNSDDIKPGQEVFAIGSPFGYEYTISSGIVAGIRENEKVNFTDPMTYLQKEKIFKKVIQITAAISPGNSGGALFNTKGEVIGINTYTFIGFGNLNFAVAINDFKEIQALAETDDFQNEDLLKRKEEGLFNSNYKIASGLKSQLWGDWYFSKMKDTMNILDSFIVRQDSVNRMRFNKAESYYKKCIALKPDSFFIYQELLDMYIFTDNFQKADNLYRDIRQQFDSDSLVNLLSSSLATAYSTSKDYSKAIQFYEKMLQQDSSQYFIHYQLGKLYEDMNDIDKAVKEYKQLLKIDMNYNDAYIQLGKIYYEKYKDISLSKKYLKKAYVKEMELSGSAPYNVDLHYYLGMIAVSEGRKLDAILSYMDLKNIYGDGIDDNKKKIKLYKAINKMDE